MNFMFEWQERYLTCERSERVRYCFCHENIKFISSSLRVVFFLLYRHPDDRVFDDLPKISDHFPKICKDSRQLVRRSHERCRTFPKTFEDARRLPKTFEEDPIVSIYWKIRHSKNSYETTSGTRVAYFPYPHL